jgi:uncharacterized spore protein YtfJ
MTRVVTVDKVRGEPIQVYGRVLIPVARIVSIVRRRGTIGTNQVSGGAGGYVYAKPVEVIEELDGDVRVLPIEDPTGTSLFQMAIIATLIPLFAGILVFLSRQLGRR